jgi:tetratricopeptide (TPR) repeat protein
MSQISIFQIVTIIVPVCVSIRILKKNEPFVSIDKVEAMSTTTLQKDICNTVAVNGKKYLVVTEDLSGEKIITTRIYLGGTILSSKRADYKKLMNTEDPERKIRDLMQREHEQALAMLGMEKTREDETTIHYVNKLLKRRKYRSALKLVTTALDQYPDEPILLSYHGYLGALVNKDYAHGINACLKAREIVLEGAMSWREFFNPVLYLNLGRTYLAAGRKEEAFEAFRTGLMYGSENEDLLCEIRDLGLRRKPIVPFLPRSSPVNKYIGKLLHNLCGLRRA